MKCRFPSMLHVRLVHAPASNSTCCCDQTLVGDTFPTYGREMSGVGVGRFFLLLELVGRPLCASRRLNFRDVALMHAGHKRASLGPTGWCLPWHTVLRLQAVACSKMRADRGLVLGILIWSPSSALIFLRVRQRLTADITWVRNVLKRLWHGCFRRLKEAEKGLKRLLKKESKRLKSSRRL